MANSTTADIFGSAGAIIRIAAALPATHTKAGFEALIAASKIIGQTDDLGEFGKTYGLTTFTPVATRGTVKRKTSFNNGSAPIRYAYVKGSADDGQAAMTAAVDSDANKAFIIEMPNGENVYFLALVMGGPLHLGTVEDVVTVSQTLEISEHDILIEDAPVSA
jgi:hypothetical protein